MTTGEVRRYFESKRVHWTLHATEERQKDGLEAETVLRALRDSGQMIESFPRGRPRREAASVLVLAWLHDGRPVHVVIGHAEEPWVIVTVYRPDERPTEWNADFTRRRR